MDEVRGRWRRGRLFFWSLALVPAPADAVHQRGIREDPRSAGRGPAGGRDVGGGAREGNRGRGRSCSGLDTVEVVQTSVPGKGDTRFPTIVAAHQGQPANSATLTVRLDAGRSTCDRDDAELSDGRSRPSRPMATRQRLRGRGLHVEQPHVMVSFRRPRRRSPAATEEGPRGARSRAPTSSTSRATS